MFNSVVQELIRRWDRELELFLRRYRTYTSKYQKREPTSFIQISPFSR